MSAVRDRLLRPASVAGVVALCAAVLVCGGCCGPPCTRQGGCCGVRQYEYPPCRSCDSRGGVLASRFKLHWPRRADKSPVREYGGVPTVPRFHPVPTRPALSDPTLPIPKLSPSLPTPPGEQGATTQPNERNDVSPSNDVPGGNSDVLVPMPVPSTSPGEGDMGLHSEPENTEEHTAQRPSGRSSSSWAFRRTPPYYSPQRR